MQATRRHTLRLATAGAALGALPAGRAEAWDAGPVAHLLPTVNHERMLIKASFREPPRDPPRLFVDRAPVPGQMADTRGQCWMFDAPDLSPGTTYRLALADAADNPLCDPWPLATFPHPDARPERFRVLFYSCAGGHDALPDHQVEGTGRFLHSAVRARIIARGLSFRPDAVVANGDHIYWDLRSGTFDRLGMAPAGVAFAGTFDRTLPVLGTPNEAVLKRSAGPQIVDVYGTMLRSTPVFFLQDDHDYYENDDADDRLVTFPPDHFMLAAGRAAQRLFYPEFLPDPNRPPGLPAASAADRPPGVSESYGTIRYGRLAEIMLYDCRRGLTLTGPSAVFVPPEVEAWLKARMAAPEVAHVVNAPSTPPGWSAGKWGEWYADILDPRTQDRLTTAVAKPYWQSGWRAQHDRLLAAASGMGGRVPLFVSGDLHSLGDTRIRRTNDMDLSRNPVVSVLPGPVGTGRPGWPSLRRGLRAAAPARLEVEERLEALEWNGFTLADFAPDKVTLRSFRWKLGRDTAEIDGLEPFYTAELPRSA